MFSPRKILVPTDFSPCAAAALDCAIDLAKKFDAEIRLLHALPLIPGVFGYQFVPLPVEWIASIRVRANAELAKEASRAGKLRVTTEVREGQVHESVLSAAEALGADLIVMGTHGRSGLSHAVLGSIAERVLRHSPIPVLTVRDPTKKS
jgi:nucleotide-binding universal stress UspA family protein